jgi:hypothetical protein
VERGLWTRFRVRTRGTRPEAGFHLGTSSRRDPVARGLSGIDFRSGAWHETAMLLSASATGRGIAGRGLDGFVLGRAPQLQLSAQSDVRRLAVGY